jgi:ribonuclease P protein component
LVVEEARGEANVPAEQSSASETTRIPTPHVDPRRSADPAIPTAEGPSSAVGLIWRVRDRATFDALRRSGRRRREGPVTVVHLAEPWPSGHAAQPPQVAFAVGRKVGSAVVRNRVRRRLRAVMADLAGSSDSPLAPGAYLISVGPEVVSLSYVELKAIVNTALQRLEDRPS